MPDNFTSLRDRIAAAIERSLVDQFPSDLPDRYGEWIDNTILADAVIEALGTRRCQRCRQAKHLDEFPLPHAGCDLMRPYCINCTDYVYWATS